MQPLYTADNTTAAYQLNWSLALFGKAPLPPPRCWLDQLKPMSERDGVRILECRAARANVLQFLISTKPATSPPEIVRCIKGRLQHLIRGEFPKAFRRNYFISSVGEADSRVLEAYVARQSAKHPMADPRVQRRIKTLQMHDAKIRLGERRTGSHGQFIHALHIVLENQHGWHEVRQSMLAQTRAMIRANARKKSWLLCRIGLVSNHIHLMVGAGVRESPQDVVLSLMNNIAYVYGMTPILRASYYVGTLGGYDRGAIRNSLDNRGANSNRDKPGGD